MLYLGKGGKRSGDFVVGLCKLGGGGGGGEGNVRRHYNKRLAPQVWIEKNLSFLMAEVLNGLPLKNPTFISRLENVLFLLQTNMEKRRRFFF